MAVQVPTGRLWEGSQKPLNFSRFSTIKPLNFK